ncbi:carotenoid 1,2-hydratase [Sphingomonas aurantiaca]
MLASEGALLGLVGGIAGIALGGIMAQVLVHVINPQSFNWTMATRVPWESWPASRGAGDRRRRHRDAGRPPRDRRRCGPHGQGGLVMPYPFTRRFERLSTGLLAAAAVTLTAATPAATDYPTVRPGARFVFPREHGAHPAFRTEWWYVTGRLETREKRDLGFQITFFRTTPKTDPANPSKFAPKQILFAHAALSDPSVGHLLHGERAARAGFGLAQARIGDTDVSLRDWRIRRLADGRFVATVKTPEFGAGVDADAAPAAAARGQGRV